jgi:hypothetical protein
MTVRANPDRRCRGEAHLAAITATRDFVVFHASYGRGGGVGRGLATGVDLGLGVGVDVAVGVGVGVPGM